jgi:iron complex outermembrane receptor protein
MKKKPLAILVGALLSAPALGVDGSAAGQEQEVNLEEVTVTATRSEAAVNTVPQTVTIITREEIEQQAAGRSGLGDILGHLVPGFSVGRESPSTFTQTFRGRNISVLIDGVPQSTNRNGARVLTLIDPSAIERIEVVHGASAAYGDGGTGGMINIITRKAKDGEFTQITEVGANISLTHPDDSLGTLLRHTVSGKTGAVDFVGNLSLEQTGAFFDAEGDRIPPTGTGQGTLAETDSYNLLGKLGYDINQSQRLQFTVNAYKAEQDTNYTTDATVPATPLRAFKARAVPGLQLDEKERTENLLLNLDYHDKDVFGSKMHAQVFWRDYKTVYSPFKRHNGDKPGPAVFQSFIDSEKKGGRLELDTLLSEKHAVTATWGVDYIEEETSQSGYVHDLATFNNSGGTVFRSTGEQRVWVPPYDLSNKAAFGQIEWQATDKMLVRTGVRYESVDFHVDDYINISDGFVQGGDLSYSDTLFNIGAVYDITNNINVFAGFNQGFSLPDVGLFLRNAPGGSSVQTLNTQPQQVDNYEIGVRGNWATTQASASVFFSESDLGSNSGGLDKPPVRAPQRVWGVEATLDMVLSNTIRTGGTFAWVEGKKYTEDWEEISYLGNDAISPWKLTAYVEHDTSPTWMNRLQVLYSGERDRFGGNTTGTYMNPIEDYAVVDWLSEKRLSKQSTLTFGINNLLNNQYHSVFAQTVVTPRVYDNTRYAAASGATAHLSYKYVW